MAKRTISLSLNSESIDNAIREFENFRTRVEEGTERLLKKLVESGAEIAQVGFQSAQYDGSNDVSVQYVLESNTEGLVVAIGGAVLFIEFGTGVKYPDDHPNASELGMIRGGYGSGRGSNPNGWVYTGDPGTNGVLIGNGLLGKVKTQGNPASMSMYNAQKELEANFLRMAKEAFS